MFEHLQELGYNEIKHRRDLIAEQIRTYKDKKYNANPLIKGFLELEKLLNKLNPKRLGHALPNYYTEQYWQNPLHYSNESNNRNPVLGVSKDGYCLRKSPTSIKPASKITIKEQSPKKSKPVSQPNAPKRYYYKINIVWSNLYDDQQEIIEKLKRLFEKLDLKFFKEYESKYGKKIEYSLSYSYEGTDSEYKIIMKALKCTLSLLDDRTNINIQGTKII